MWLFPRDNNGLLVTLPAVSPTGAPSATGTLVFGIGTQANNGLGSARVYATDDSGNVTTNFNGVDYTGSVRVGTPIQGTLSAGA